MKVKNIMFFGFAAAILSAGAASAAVTHPTTTNYGATDKTIADADRKIVTSKAYVDDNTNKLAQDIRAINIPGAVTDLSDAANYELTANKLQQGESGTSTITASSTDTQYPSARNVYKLVDEKVSAVPAAGNAELDIQVNGASVGTFTANATTDSSINITVPTTVAQLTDSSDYATVTYVNTQDALDEKVANKTTTVSSASTDTQYPSAKAVYTAVQAVAEDVPTTVAELSDAADYATVTYVNNQDALDEKIANKVTSMSSSSTDTQYPSAKAVYDAIDAATHGNSIPAQPSACSQTGNTCALITNTDGSLQWVVMADDQHGGSVPSGN